MAGKHIISESKMKRNVLLILCTLPLWVNAQTTVQVLDSVVSYLDGNNGVKYEYQYDGKGNAVSETSFYWNSSSNTWTKNRKWEYQCDDNKNTWITFYRDNNSNMWVKNKKYEYLYDENETWITFYWDSSSNIWVENKKYEYQYDESYPDENDGVKYEYQYDEKGNAVSETCFYWDSSINTWVKNRKWEYQYDAKNQTWITFYWDSSINTWIENKKREYQYDDTKNQTLETGSFWDNSIHAWTKISTAQYNYYYSSITVNTIFQVNSEQPATVFPNPATNYITVRGTAESVITISGLSGGIVYKQVMAGENQTIDVSSYASGIYLISVEAGKSRTVSKIIKL